jgi:hypothetical protein
MKTPWQANLQSLLIYIDDKYYSFNSFCCHTKYKNYSKEETDDIKIHKRHSVNNIQTDLSRKE